MEENQPSTSKKGTETLLFFTLPPESTSTTSEGQDVEVPYPRTSTPQPDDRNVTHDCIWNFSKVSYRIFREELQKPAKRTRIISVKPEEAPKRIISGHLEDRKNQKEIDFTVNTLSDLQNGPKKDAVKKFFKKWYKCLYKKRCYESGDEFCAASCECWRNKSLLNKATAIFDDSLSK